MATVVSACGLEACNQLGWSTKIHCVPPVGNHKTLQEVEHAPFFFDVLLAAWGNANAFLVGFSRRPAPADLMGPLPERPFKLLDNGSDAPCLAGKKLATRNKCIATRNKCLTSRSKDATRNKCIAYPVPLAFSRPSLS